MRPSLRTTASGETDFELLTLATSTGVTLTGASWLIAGLPVPRCAFHLITGCPCPTCGTTRAILALVHGHPLAALSWNPLAIAALAFFIPLNLYSALAVSTRIPRIRLNLSPPETRLLGLIFTFLVASNWAYEIHHGV
jgi:hypothetical protein